MAKGIWVRLAYSLDHPIESKRLVNMLRKAGYFVSSIPMEIPQCELRYRETIYTGRTEIRRFIEEHKDEHRSDLVGFCEKV